ncbi:Bug family tripartite tricarboxylate transporter substrate binding protein [Piscinibacter koreensis]|uniref:Tripartite tricarboxylate transporter substrate binding protein n=1 Tax=Piscinibacter koreensis TaxID=2742824 RepID=A0A7Y6NNP6_9BURK|nr:tripartite tricarboxylate transporter substrate binding protein [Schlegelella koreensis]NUZ06541.1 tripartite tricarboxylate transporter substrate binding protein [Schlegelella koreensis]
MLSSSRRLTLLLPAALALASTLGTTPAVAQGYPTKPVRLIVPYAAGGGTDFFARTVGGKLGEQLGQTIVVENKPGAATIIGAEAAAHSPADGYTVLLADSTTLAVNPSLYKKLPYDPVKDFAPVSLTARFAMLLVVNPNLSKATTVREFIDEAKREAGKMSFASVGAGTTHHLTMELFQQRAGIKLSHVPYKGAGPAIQDVVAGQVPVMFVDLAAGSPMIKAGRLRVLAVASPRRITALPNVPTFAEQGIPNFEAWAWQGLAVPTGTPRDAIARLNAEFAKAVQDPAVRQKLVDAGVEPIASTPDEMAAYIRSETAKWAQVIKQADIRIE